MMRDQINKHPLSQVQESRIITDLSIIRREVLGNESWSRRGSSNGTFGELNPRPRPRRVQRRIGTLGNAA